MNRRLLVTTFAALAATPVYAQSTMSAGGRAAGPERDHAMRTAMTGMLSLQTSDIALEKARGAKVKEFAKLEHDEQTTVADILKSFDPDIAPPAPDAKGAEMMRKLKEANGAAFDKMFVMGQIDAHHMLLTYQEDYLKAGSMREHVNVAKLVRGMVKEHLVLLSDLHKSVG